MNDPSEAAIDDRTLVSRIAGGGDDRAFAALYDRHTPALYRLARRLLGGDESAAEDVVHDAWVSAVPRLAAFEWRATLSTWLSGFVINHARNRQRADAREVEITDNHADDDRAVTGTHDRVDLERALAMLPHGYREVLVLHDVDGFTHEEIARALDVSPGTSRSQLS
ncbi:MAG: RNA polymerase sigma factor, partial [Gemmatimonadaceae bacterium]